jgi:hypothetical protein
MNRIVRSTTSSVLFFFVFCLLLSPSAQAKQAQKADKVMPAGSGAMLVPAALPPDPAPVTISSPKDGVRYYSDGRIAEVRDKSSVDVYVYQEAEGSYTVYHKDSKEKTYSVDQYLRGKLYSTLLPNGDYTVFYEDGKVRSQLVHEGKNVFYYDYSYQSTHEIDADGNWNPIVFLTEKNAYLSTPSGLTAYSTTTYTRESMNVGSPVTSQTVYYSDPVVESSPVRKQPVNFGKVLRKALNSAKDPAETKKARTNDRSIYAFEAGTLRSVTYDDKTTYNFLDGVLVSVYQGNTLLVKLTDQGLVKV